MPSSPVEPASASSSSRSRPAHTTSDIGQEFREFAYVVSHDLGAPARLMVEFARLLSSRLGTMASEEDRRLLREIVDNGEKLRGMMHGLLAYSRLNTLAAQHVVIDTRKIAEHAALLMREKLKAVGGKLTIGAMPQLMGDPDQIMQLLSFLFDNAIRFARPGVPAEIHLEADGHPGGWQVSLRDNGIGIATADWLKVFKPFQRLDPDDPAPGYGMGLALARKIVELHGGDIWIEESSPNGTLIRFTLVD